MAARPAAASLQPAVPAAAPGRIGSVAAITRVVNAASDWLSGLPVNPATEFLQGAFVLIRRTLFADIAEMPKCATTSNKDCSGQDFDGANLAWLDLSGVNFTRAGLVGADLNHANLNGAVLDYARLTYDADLIGAQLVSASLRNADLSGGVFLTGANLAGADLSGAILDSSMGGIPNLTDANLSGANLSGARLGGAVLSRANLARADMTNADLRLADLTGADLTGAALTGVWWDDTTCPNGSKTDTGCSSGAGNAAQYVSSYQFHWEATWIRTWYDLAHHESYDYTGTLPQNPVFNWSKAGGDYTASFVEDPDGAAHFRYHVHSNSSGNMSYSFTIASPMVVTAFSGPRCNAPGKLGCLLGVRPADIEIGATLPPGTYTGGPWAGNGLYSTWLGFFGLRVGTELWLDLEPVTTT